MSEQVSTVIMNTQVGANTRAVSTPGHSAWYRTEPYGLYSTEALIEGLPTVAENCEFYISAGKDFLGTRYYSLPVQATPE
ncbi:hypothetical protein V5799_006677 [Amblyomma americanum]|uniref:Uncharacterized protein n=1 Tax=Amblyomma americanum TaxID=6943 RepID=A0AAQ4DVQ3_AMBAM